MKYLRNFLILTILCVSTVIYAQDDDTCSGIVDQILSDVSGICAETGRNQVCFGHMAMEVITREDIGAFQFEQVGDIADAVDIQTLKLSPLSMDGEAWGVALMRLQANIPDTLPGQNVTFVLFGDVELSNAVEADSSEARPMQAFYLTTGIGQPECASVPQSGLLVQTPQGAGEVLFSVNGVDISFGSTVFLQAQAGNEMSVRTLEGMAMVVYEEENYPVLCGTQLSVPLGEDLLPSDIPGELESMEIIEYLPLTLIDDEREFAEPATEEQLQGIIEHLENDGELCGDEPFPSCDDYPWLEDWELPETRWGDDGFGDTEWEDIDFDDIDVDDYYDTDEDVDVDVDDYDIDVDVDDYDIDVDVDVDDDDD